MTHELILLNRVDPGWVLANLHSKLHIGAIGPGVDWKFKNQMHDHSLRGATLAYSNLSGVVP